MEQWLGLELKRDGLTSCGAGYSVKGGWFGADARRLEFCVDDFESGGQFLGNNNGGGLFYFILFCCCGALEVVVI